MKEYLTSLVTPLLTEPQALFISEARDEQGTFLSMNVSKPDMGRVLGKNGDTIKAIRTILFAVGGMAKQSVRLKVLEPQLPAASQPIHYGGGN